MEMDSDDEEFSDDDDLSWKVRRAACKLLKALVETRPDLLSEHYTVMAPPLISSFKEREENVRTDVLGVFTSILTQTKRSSPTTAGSTMEVDGDTRYQSVSFLCSPKGCSRVQPRCF